jgi:hypothetical protein
MKFSRLAATTALPATLLLAACGGGSSGIVGGGGGALGQQANVRFVQGSPSTSSVDVYFQSTGSASPSTPLIAALPYAVPSDFKTLPTVAGSVIVQTAGGGAPSTGTAALTSCPVPQFANNANYTIAIVNANGVINCVLFQDAVYTGTGQYRFHDASPNQSAAVAFGTTTAPGTPGTSTFAVQGTAPFGQLAAGNSAAASYTLVTPVTLGTTANVSFAVGTSAGQTATATNTLDAGALMLAGSTTQPNSGNNNYTVPTGLAGASIYDIACGGTATLPSGAHCVGGNALVGVFDTH